MEDSLAKSIDKIKTTTEPASTAPADSIPAKEVSELEKAVKEIAAIIRAKQ